MGLSTGDGYDALMGEGLDFYGVGLVGLVVGVLWEVADVVEAQLTVGGLAPGVDVTFTGEGHGVGVATA